MSILAAILRADAIGLRRHDLAMAGRLNALPVHRLAAGRIFERLVLGLQRAALLAGREAGTDGAADKTAAASEQAAADTQKALDKAADATSNAADKAKDAATDAAAHASDATATAAQKVADKARDVANDAKANAAKEEAKH